MVSAGPMFGSDMKPAQEVSYALEQEVLARAGLQADVFAPHKRLTQGTRRPTLAWLDHLDIEEEQQDTPKLRFSLPLGSYATEQVQGLTGG